MRLSMHTNGSARTQSWWKKLAKLNINVAFGIDGLGDTHALYRINTDWDKIIENAKAYIDAGGEAEWHMLVFKHNEHQIGACQHMADQMGFKKFQVKHTSRFNDNKWHVLDDAGRTTHILEPTQKSIDMIPRVKQAVTNQTPVIQCKAKKYRQIYVAADGTVSPCCWLDFSWILPLQDTRIDYMDNIGVMPSLASNSLAEIFESGYFDKIEATWTDKPLMECSKQCGEFDKLMEQFVEH
jgi:sulfatase maturation enzyme AslB (radical SAM superfamily)